MCDIALTKIHDLHSHTTASDGYLSPEELVKRAVDNRVGVLAITDHDSVSGLARARAEIIGSKLPVQLISGIEISTVWENHEIHIIGLGINEHHPELASLLVEQNHRRYQRASAIAQRLEKVHIYGALEGAMNIANKGAITRSHFARFLIESGKAKTMTEVFKKYLSKGKIGYVSPVWCTIGQAIDIIHYSGGQAVLAHPARYGLSTKWLKRLLSCFAENGGDAMEVAQCQQVANERQLLASYAKQFNLLASQGSDFHQPCAWIELGRNLWLPANVEPVWKDWDQH